ncbi:MAG: hypothetical protein H7210_11955 [Pyrinomonadaceae bacterium]|nr:hypothetical protein [Phycisphaerales bacterium]
MAERIREVETRTRRITTMVPTGWAPMDDALGGGLAGGALHEWFGVIDAPQTRTQRWTPPLLILSHLVRQSVRASKERPWCLWVGERVWPTPHGMMGLESDHRGILARSLFVAPSTEGERTWAIDLALRVAGLVVIADASSLSMASTRRLQLAAEAGGSLGLLARPPHERGELSAASTRWEITRSVSTSENPCWQVQLSRCKGLQAIGTHTVVVERNHGGAVIPVPADLPLRSRPAALAS